MRSSSQTRKSGHHHEHHEDYEATICGLHKWTKHMFEKLGWMVLTKAKRTDGKNPKITAYLDGLERLLMSIEHRMKLTDENDTRMDLAILHENVSILHKHARRDLIGAKSMKQNGGGKK